MSRKSFSPEIQPALKFLKNRGWKAFPFQLRAWQAYREGESGLLHIPTGSGKTYAAVLAAFSDYVTRPRPGLKALYITPLRALTRDLEIALNEPIVQEKWPLKIASRTGDTSAHSKRKQLKNPADLLLTTPESLAVMISQSDAEEVLKSVELVILDEWHELLSTKRGTQTELGVAYLKSLNPDLQVWALSASIGNLEEAAQAAVGLDLQPVILSGGMKRKIEIECLLPDKIDAFPWGGHLGLRLRDPLIHRLDPEGSTLIFTNTRSQAERWYQSLQESLPQMGEKLALHHGSLDRAEREKVEEGVKSGNIRWVVCTSSLDLGVDFQPVEKVVQIGSPKMVARMMQRAGRSAHRPGATGSLLFVPTNSWEILELEAVRKALREERVESRTPREKPMDVLVQQMTTLACGPGLKLDEFTESLKKPGPIEISPRPRSDGVSVF